MAESHQTEFLKKDFYLQLESLTMFLENFQLQKLFHCQYNFFSQVFPMAMFSMPVFFTFVHDVSQMPTFL